MVEGKGKDDTVGTDIGVNVAGKENVNSKEVAEYTKFKRGCRLSKGNI